MCKITPQMIKDAKQMIVNLEVAKTMDRKTNTRRLPKKKILDIKMSINKKIVTFEGDISNQRMYEDEFIKKFAQHKVGEVYWVREPVQITLFDDILQQYDYQYVSDGRNVYQADIPKKYRRPNHPRWMKNLHRVPNGCIKEMARTFVKITNVRVERLQDITYQDIYSEGIDSVTEKMINEAEKTDAKKDIFGWIIKKNREAWIILWNSTAPKGYKYLDNPYVFCYTFETMDKKDI